MASFDQKVISVGQSGGNHVEYEQVMYFSQDHRPGQVDYQILLDDGSTSLTEPLTITDGKAGIHFPSDTPQLVRLRKLHGDTLPLSEAWRPVFTPEGLAFYSQQTATGELQDKVRVQHSIEEIAGVDLRLIFYPDAGSAKVTPEAFHLDPGERIEIRIQQDATQDSVAPPSMLLLADEDNVLDICRIKQPEASTRGSIHFVNSHFVLGKIKRSSKLSLEVNYLLSGSTPIQGMVLNRFGESLSLDLDPAKKRSGSFILGLDLGQLHTGSNSEMVIAECFFSGVYAGQDHFTITADYSIVDAISWPVDITCTPERLKKYMPLRIRVWKMQDGQAVREVWPVRASTNCPALQLRTRFDYPDGVCIEMKSSTDVPCGDYELMLEDLEDNEMYRINFKVKAEGEEE